MEQQQQIERLRAILADEGFSPELREAVRVKLSGLEPEPAVQSQPEPEPQPEQPKSVKGVFDAILEQSAIEAREQAAMVDRTERVCGTCYSQQPVSELCELCGDTPNWFVPSKLNSEQQMFARMARESKIDQLKTALRSGWATTKERQNFLAAVVNKLTKAGEALHLRLRQSAQRQAQRKDATSNVTQAPPPWKITNEQVQAATRFYDLQLEKLKETKQ